MALRPPLVGLSSHGIRCLPPAGIPSARPLPGAGAPFGPALPHASSRSVLVVSHHHNGFLHARVTGLLHPATGQGFAAFHACRHRATRRWASDGTIPATRFTPFEDFPSSAAVPTSLWPLPSCRYRPARPGRRLAPKTCRPQRHRSGVRTPRCACSRAPTAAAPRGTVSWYPARGVRSMIGRCSEEQRGRPEG